MKFEYLFTFLVILFSFGAHAQQDATGKLFIIGGGERPTSLVEAMISTADMKEGDFVVVLPMASSIPDTVSKFITDQINALIPAKVLTFNFQAGESVNQERIDSLSNARLIYITGGDQNKFMEVVRDTPIQEAIRGAYQGGATIAGTSAGAAVMSFKMITGAMKNSQEYGNFDKIWFDNAVIGEGLGLLENVIIDQHFIARSRYNRLLSVLADHPDSVCVGIDESTAIIVEGKEIKVVGESQVVFLSQPNLIPAQNKKLVSFRDIKFALLSHGETFMLTK